MTQEELQKIAEDGKLFEKLSKDTLFGTSDGQIFKEKQRAKEFAGSKEKPLKVYELENPDAEKEAEAAGTDPDTEQDETEEEDQAPTGGLSDPNK